jgi:hypothetical protein
VNCPTIVPTKNDDAPKGSGSKSTFTAANNSASHLHCVGLQENLERG